MTGQALALGRVIQSTGHESQIVAEHVAPELVGTVVALAGLSSQEPEPDVTILRYSIWSATVEEVLALPPRRLGLIYHNVTPPHLLKMVNPTVAALCQRARTSLSALAPLVHLALADSEFNAQDLEQAGFEQTRVVPLLLDLPSRRQVEPDPQRSPLVLSVGRVVPSKQLEVLIRAVALLRQAHVPDARLVLVGSWDGFADYRDALARFAAVLGVDDAVDLAGQVSDQRRDALLAEASIYACASAHEGFCAPLVEAMAVGVPVVAAEAAAVPETVGGGGLVLPSADPCAFAEAMAEVLASAQVRRTLRAGADARLQQLAPQRVAGLLEDALGQLLAG